MSSTRVFGLLLSCALLGCADEAPQLTEMVVVVEGGAQLRGMADRLEVSVTTSGDPTMAATVPASTLQTFMRPAWPISLTLLASQPKATLSVAVTAYVGVTPLVTKSVVTTFLPERSLLLGVRLDDACINDPAYCAGYAGMTCEAVAGTATCVANTVDARSLPDYEGQRYDAGIPPVVVDAGSDAGVGDADASGDAAP
jgi:hypothetical protein